jgi:hypothetical protein
VKDLLLSEKRFELTKDVVFISGGIEKGATWFQSIVEALKKSRVGIVCLTTENLHNPWLHFEAGALSRALDDNGPPGQPPKAGDGRLLIPLLHGVSAAEMTGPLSAYQATYTSRADLALMMSRVGDVLGKPGACALTEDHWKQFQTKLDALAVPFRDLIPEFEGVFQNPSFNQPCKGQDWMRCYDGALLAREMLRSHQNRVRAACAAHELGLFDMLLADLGSYAEAVEGLLEGGSDDLKRAARLEECERRRLAVKSVSWSLLDPPQAPLRSNAVRFLAAETDAERNMLVLAMESEIRRERDAVFEAEEPPDPAAEPRKDAGIRQRFDKAMVALTGRREPTKFRESSWDLDRIFYYLLIRYFESAPIRWNPAQSTNPVESAKPATHHWRCAARDVTLELERYKLGSKGVSLLPIKYSLDALATIEKANGKKSPDIDVTRNSILSAVAVVRADLGDELSQSEVGIVAQIKRLLARLETAAAPR